MSDNESLSGNEEVPPKKWYSANLGHEFLDEYGEFDLKAFKFPPLTSALSTFNLSGVPDEYLKGVDVKSTLRSYANDIGNSIKDAFHVTIPNHVLWDISKHFVDLYPNATANFDRMLKDRKGFKIEDIDKPNKGKPEKRFKHIGDCLYKCLELWKVAHKAAKNRDDSIPAEELIRPGKAHASLVEGLKNRRDIRKNERDSRTSGKASLRERFAKLEADHATLKHQNESLLVENDNLKQSNATLVEQKKALENRIEESDKAQLEHDSTKQELDELKIRFGHELDYEPHRLQLKDKEGKKVQGKEVEINVGTKRLLTERNASGRRGRKAGKKK